MTAEVVPFVPKRDGYNGEINPRDLAIERCADRIERSMRTRLTIEERIGLERALDELVDEVEWHRRDPR